MSFSNNREIKKTRKDHWCVCCGIVIPKGSNCTYFAGTCDGDFYSDYTCNYCKQWVKDHRNDLDNPFYWDDVSEMMWDELRQKCETCKSWDKIDEECELETDPRKNNRCLEYSEKEAR